MRTCLITNMEVEWDKVVAWSAVLRRKLLWNNLSKLCLGAMVYNLWRQMSDLVHSNVPHTKESIVARIRLEVRSKIPPAAASLESALWCTWSLVD
jgi:hypothetical protein